MTQPPRRRPQRPRWSQVPRQGAAPAALRLLGVGVWLAATLLSWRFDLLRAYGDALAHELIARRLVDALVPGLAQLGTVWLPLPPLLLAPLAALDVVWHSGLAGALLGLVYLQLALGALFRAGWLLGGSAAGWTAALVFAANPNTLYLFTTPLTEAPAMAFTCLCAAAVADLLDSFQRQQPRHGAIIVASSAAAAALLSRYDGWALALLAGLVVLLASRVWLHRPRAWEGVPLAFALLPLNAIGLWLLYNLLIFGDPLEFLRGEHASARIVEDLARRGVIPTLDGRPMDAGRPAAAMLSYAGAALETLGWLPSALGLAGLAAAIWRARAQPAGLALLVLAAPLLFYPLALSLGQSVIVTRAANPAGLLNVRYASMLAPLAALAAAALVAARHPPHSATPASVSGRQSPVGLAASPSPAVGGRRSAVPYPSPGARPLAPGLMLLAPRLAAAGLTVAALLSGASLFLDPFGPAVIAEGALQRASAAPSYEAARWLAAQPDDGLVLLDDALQPQAKVILVHGGRPLRRFLDSTAPDRWQAALREPDPEVAWIVVLGPQSRDLPNDRVAATLLQDTTIPAYQPAFDNGHIRIFRRAGLAPSPPGFSPGA